MRGIGNVVEVQPFGGIDPLFSLGEKLLRGFHDQLLPNCWPLHCRIRSVELAVLIIDDGAADANGFNALTTHLESDFTILSYDRRGLSRSVLKPGAPPVDVSRHTGDAPMVLAEVTSEPAFVFSVSIGALIGLDLVTTHPVQIRMLVAHEPPLEQLPPSDELDKALHEQEEVEVVFR